MGRPKANVDLEAVTELAAEGNTLKDTLSAIGICKATFYNRKDILKAFEQGRSLLRVNLRHWQLASAKSGNPAMLIWLGRNWLGQSENPETDAENSQNEDALSKSLKDFAAEMNKNDK